MNNSNRVLYKCTNIYTYMYVILYIIPMYVYICIHLYTLMYIGLEFVKRYREYENETYLKSSGEKSSEKSPSSDLTERYMYVLYYVIDE
jgi:hypothetical protein